MSVPHLYLQIGLFLRDHSGLDQELQVPRCRWTEQHGSVEDQIHLGLPARTANRASGMVASVRLVSGSTRYQARRRLKHAPPGRLINFCTEILPGHCVSPHAKVAIRLQCLAILIIRRLQCGRDQLYAESRNKLHIDGRANPQEENPQIAHRGNVFLTSRES
jgi:hypothetical protein